MKRLLAFMLITMLFCTPTYAGTITYTTLSSDAGISYSHFNDSFSAIYNEFNGSVESANIADDTLAEADFADAINPRVRDNEQIGSFTYSGHLPVTSTDLTSNISAGTSYVNGYRVVTNATSKTYTASKDTYVYIDINGAFQYQEVANGASQPSDPSNSLLLALVVTDSDNITTVTDKRQTTPPSLRIYQDFKTGLVISRDSSDINTVTIDRGQIDFGSSVTSGLRRNTSSVSVDFDTSGRGGLDTGSQAANTYYYIHAVADDDNTTGYEGIASTSSTDASGVTGERLVGWIYSNSTTALSVDACGANKEQGGDAPNLAWASKSEFSQAVAVTTLTPVYLMKFYSSGRPVRINYHAGLKSASSTQDVYEVLSIDSIGIPESKIAWRTNDTDSSFGAGGSVIRTLSKGVHDIELKVYVYGAQAHTLTDYSLIVEEE